MSYHLTITQFFKVALVRQNTEEIGVCRVELKDQHRDLQIIARTLSSARSSKRAQESGLLEHRIREKLHALEVSHISYTLKNAFSGKH